MKILKMPSHWQWVCMLYLKILFMMCLSATLNTQLNPFIIVIQSLCFDSINVTAWKKFTIHVQSSLLFCVLHFLRLSRHFSLFPCLTISMFNFELECVVTLGYFFLYTLNAHNHQTLLKAESLRHDTDFITGHTNVLMGSNLDRNL